MEYVGLLAPVAFVFCIVSTCPGKLVKKRSGAVKERVARLS